MFLLLATIALVGAAIAGLSQIMPAWLAALLLAVLFLIILAVAALIGVSTIKKALPLVPRKALFGVKYDLGVVKEGSAYTESRVQREEQLARERKEQEKREAAQDPAQQKPRRPPRSSCGTGSSCAASTSRRCATTCRAVRRPSSPPPRGSWTAPAAP